MLSTLAQAGDPKEILICGTNFEPVGHLRGQRAEKNTTGIIRILLMWLIPSLTKYLMKLSTTET